MERTAACACGSVRVVAAGEPVGVVACRCLDCQRRTGSVLGVGAYYPQERITVTGVTKEFVRPTESGGSFSTHFCPRCGTSLHWSSGKNPGLVGVAVGAFADPAFPAPVRSVFERSMHAWVRVDVAPQHFPKGRTG